MSRTRKGFLYAAAALVLFILGIFVIYVWRPTFDRPAMAISTGPAAGRLRASRASARNTASLTSGGGGTFSRDTGQIG